MCKQIIEEHIKLLGVLLVSNCTGPKYLILWWVMLHCYLTVVTPLIYFANVLCILTYLYHNHAFLCTSHQYQNCSLPMHHY
jgi:hypothetical protein